MMALDVYEAMQSFKNTLLASESSLFWAVFEFKQITKLWMYAVLF